MVGVIKIPAQQQPTQEKNSDLELNQANSPSVGSRENLRRDVMLGATTEPGQIGQLQVRHSWWALTKIFMQAFCATGAGEPSQVRNIKDMDHGCNIGPALQDTGVAANAVYIRENKNGSFTVSIPANGEFSLDKKGKKTAGLVADPNALIETCITNPYDLDLVRYTETPRLKLNAAGDRYELTFNNQFDSKGSPFITKDSVFAFRCGDTRWHINVGLAMQLYNRDVSGEPHKAETSDGGSSSRSRQARGDAEFREDLARDRIAELIESGDEEFESKS